VVLPVAIRADRVQSINNFIHQQTLEHDCFVGFGTVHADMEDIPGEVERIIGMGLRGIKIHPDCQKFDIDDPKLFPLYDAIQGRIPIILHMGDQRYSHSHPARLRHIMDEFPKLEVIAAHFGGYTVYETARQELQDTNCIMDVSSSLMFMEPGVAEKYINLYGAERLAFGTDYPLWDPVKEVQRFLDLKITPEQKEQIAWKTAKEFLHM
jgi:predicted TIM-barrel fold metal-dependent hydrolase